jgi:hypothetical protein
MAARKTIDHEDSGGPVATLSFDVQLAFHSGHAISTTFGNATAQTGRHLEKHLALVRTETFGSTRRAAIAASYHH